MVKKDSNNDKIPNIYSTASYFTIYNCFVIFCQDIFLKSLNPKIKKPKPQYNVHNNSTMQPTTASQRQQDIYVGRGWVKNGLDVEGKP